MSHRMNFLFPIPSQPPSVQSPYRWPGISPQSTSSLIKVLKDNHERLHILFGDRLHNHSAHRALALWSLGVDGMTIEAGYQRNLAQKQSSFNSPEPILKSNFEEHLGDERYYQSYVDFFAYHVHQNGMQNTLETFVFSRKYNFDGKKPEMLSRFMAGLLHPMIHAGFGTEFGLPGLMVEGLAQAAIHDPEVSELLSPSFFDPTGIVIDTASANPNNLNSVISAARRIEQIAAGLNPNSAPTLPTLKAQIGSNKNTGDVHALTILARVMADSRLDHPEDVREHTLVQKTIKKHADLIRHYTSQWTIDIHKCNEINDKFQELVWMNAVIYGIAGWTWAHKVKGGGESEFNADLFLAHFVTSSLFLPSLLAYLQHSPHSQVLLLRSYLGVCLSWYVARGRPQLDIHGFYTSPSTAFENQDTSQAWLPLVERVIPHPDEHLPKVILTLANYASKLGATPAGTFSGPDPIESVNAVHREQYTTEFLAARKTRVATELPGAEHLDGTLFLRIARLTVTRLEKVGQGEISSETWERKGFYRWFMKKEQERQRLRG